MGGYGERKGEERWVGRVSERRKAGAHEKKRVRKVGRRAEKACKKVAAHLRDVTGEEVLGQRARPQRRYKLRVQVGLCKFRHGLVGPQGVREGGGLACVYTRVRTGDDTCGEVSRRKLTRVER